MNSPLTGITKTTLLKKISKELLIEKYQKNFNLNISHLLNQVETVQLYKCNDTGYRFFYPFSLTGDGKFYEHLQKLDWYYMPWKWEHEQAAKYIQKGMEVLEVGCGKGGFLEEINKRYKIDSVGLELNDLAVKEMKEKGLNVYSTTIQEYSNDNPEHYDIVCSFQVLEHIADVKSFLESQIKSLKIGGKLIVSVPNNDGFLGDDENLLNMPPHHMGLWNEKSLLNMGELFSLKHIATHFEPLQLYHQEYYDRVKKKKLSSFGRFFSILNRFLPLEKSFLPKNYSSFTIQVVWEK